MAQSEGGRSEGGPRGGLSTLLIVLIGQMGCLAVIVISLSVMAGLWLDNFFQTKPIITLALLLAGVPVSVLLMLFVARKSLAKLRSQLEQPAAEKKEAA